MANVLKNPLSTPLPISMFFSTWEKLLLKTLSPTVNSQPKPFNTINRSRISFFPHLPNKVQERGKWKKCLENE